MSSAWISPALLTAMRASIRFSRAWMSETNEFEPVGDEFHRPAEHDRGGGRGDLVAEGVDLEPERAADVRRHDPHIVLGHLERAREHGLDHVRHLAAGMDRQALRVLVVIGDERARLEAHRGVAAEAERALDHDVGRREDRVHPAGIDHLAERQVVAELGVQRRRAGHRARSPCGRRRAAPPSRSPPARRRPPPARASRATTITTGSPCQHARSTAIGYCGADFMPGKQVSVPTHGPAHILASSAPVITLTTPGARAAALGVEAHDARMRMGAAHERGVHHARQRDVVGVGAASRHRAPRAEARQRAPHVAVRPVERGQSSLGVHVLPWPRSPAGASLQRAARGGEGWGWGAPPAQRVIASIRLRAAAG